MSSRAQQSPSLPGKPVLLSLQNRGLPPGLQEGVWRPTPSPARWDVHSTSLCLCSQERTKDDLWTQGTLRPTRESEPPPWVWDPDSRTDSWEQGGEKEWLAATSLGHSEWQASASVNGDHLPSARPCSPRPPQTRGFRELRGSGLRVGSWAVNKSKPPEAAAQRPQPLAPARLLPRWLRPCLAPAPPPRARAEACLACSIS